MAKHRAVIPSSRVLREVRNGAPLGVCGAARSGSDVKITSIELAQRIEWWQGILAPLGVSHFRIERVTCCEETTSKCNAIATSRIPSHYDSVYFEFTDDFLEEATERRLDEVIVHEWLHVAHRDVDEAMRAPRPWMAEQAYDDWVERVEHEHEGLIERLARFIVALQYRD